MLGTTWMVMFGSRATPPRWASCRAMTSGGPTQRRSAASSTRNQTAGGSSRARIAWRASRAARRSRTWCSGTPGVTAGSARAVLLGLEQPGEDAELPDAQGRGLLLVLDPAAEPRRGGDPGAGLGVELAEPPVPAGERPVAHLREQFRRRALA